MKQNTRKNLPEWTSGLRWLRWPRRRVGRVWPRRRVMRCSTGVMLHEKINCNVWLARRHSMVLMIIERNLTVPAGVMTGIGEATWPCFSHIVCTFVLDESIILVSNETNITCMLWLNMHKWLTTKSSYKALFDALCHASASSNAFVVLSSANRSLSASSSWVFCCSFSRAACNPTPR